MDNKIIGSQMEDAAREYIIQEFGNPGVLKTENLNIVNAINELLGKDIIAEAMGLPVNPTDTFTVMGNKMNAIKTILREELKKKGIQEDLSEASIDYMVRLIPSVSSVNPNIFSSGDIITYERNFPVSLGYVNGACIGKLNSYDLYVLTGGTSAKVMHIYNLKTKSYESFNTGLKLDGCNSITCLPESGLIFIPGNIIYTFDPMTKTFTTKAGTYGNANSAYKTTAFNDETVHVHQYYSGNGYKYYKYDMLTQTLTYESSFAGYPNGIIPEVFFLDNETMLCYTKWDGTYNVMEVKRYDLVSKTSTNIDNTPINNKTYEGGGYSVLRLPNTKQLIMYGGTRRENTSPVKYTPLRSSFMYDDDTKTVIPMGDVIGIQGNDDHLNTGGKYSTLPIDDLGYNITFDIRFNVIEFVSYIN